MGIAGPGGRTAAVAFLRWPVDGAQRDGLRRRGTARLWLVEGGAAPPDGVDWLEDWIRAPAAEEDLAARTANLAQRVEAQGGGAQWAGGLVPVVDGDGVLRMGPAWVPLPPVEHRLTAALVDRFGAVVNRDALSVAGWPSGAPGRNALDVHVLRLRRRIRPLGLEIRTVRSRGYLLEAAGRVTGGPAAEAVANLA